MAGYRGSTSTVSIWWRLWIALWLVLCVAGTSEGESRRVYDINLQAQSLADALNGLSEQTGAPVVFSYDLVRSKRSRPVVGRYTLPEALATLLRDTGLYGGLSDRGVLTVSATRLGPPNTGEMTLNNNQKTANVDPRRVTRPSRIAAFFAAVAAAFSASAEEVGDAPNNIEEVLVTAQKQVERMQDVPVPISVINTESLADTGQVLLRDYYSEVPGLNVTPLLGSNESIAIRGISTGGVTNPTVAIMVDGVPYTASTLFTGGNQVPDFDPGDLDRIEVLRGPQGTLYGANSLGGLINYVTRDPSTERYSGRIEAGIDDVYAGTEQGFNLRASANIPVTDTFAMRASAYTSQDPGYISNPVYHEKGVNEIQAYGGRWSGLWKPADNFSIKLSAQYQRIEADGVSEVDVGPNLGDLQQNDIPGTAPYSRLTQAYSAIVNYKVGGVDLTSVTGYNTNRFFDSVDFTSALGSFAQSQFQVGGAPVFEQGDTSKLTQELRLSTPLGPHFEWMIGAFFAHEVSSDIQVIWAGNTNTEQLVGQLYYQNSPAAYLESAGFTDLTCHITDRFDVQLGGRESHIDVIENTSLVSGPLQGATVISPQLVSKANAFTYLVTPQLKLSSDLMLYARLASGYRPGGANGVELNAPFAYGPDKTQNYEFGMKGDFLDHTLSLDASVYYIRWENIQIQLLNSQDLQYQDNGGNAKSEGVEVSVTARPVMGLSLGASFAYDDAALTQDFPGCSASTGTCSISSAFGLDGDRLPDSARLSGNFSGKEEFPIPVWRDASGFVVGQVSYVGDRVGVFTSAPQRQLYGGYAKIDARAGVKYDSWTVQAYVNNVADRRGALDGGLGYYNQSAFILIQPRTVGLSVAKTF